jgi:hypothetical protein
MCKIASRRLDLLNRQAMSTPFQELVAELECGGGGFLKQFTDILARHSVPGECRGSEDVQESVHRRADAVRRVGQRQLKRLGGGNCLGRQTTGAGLGEGVANLVERGFAVCRQGEPPSRFSFERLHVPG